MKKIICLLSVVLFNISCTQAQTEFKEAATDYKMQSLTGEEVQFKRILRQNYGKITVIEVWASWCSDCVKNMNKIKELQAANPDLNYVFLSVDKTPEAWKKGIEKHEIQGTHYLIADGMKGVFGKAIDLDWIPRYIVLDKNGKIVLYKAIETDFDKINETIKSLK